jgi:hypothetical protein
MSLCSLLVQEPGSSSRNRQHHHHHHHQQQQQQEQQQHVDGWVLNKLFEGICAFSLRPMPLGLIYTLLGNVQR